jgi:hypothetical protein
VQKDAKAEIECIYLGDHQVPAGTTVRPPAPPSDGFAREVALAILSGDRGTYMPTAHYRGQMAARNFDVFDMEYAIRNGSCTEGGKYSDEHKNHKYVFRCLIDGVEFDAVFALSVEHHLIDSPLMVLITGCWKTKSGKRRNRY